MSQITTKALLAAPSGSNGVVATTAASVWGNGSWVEILASTSGLGTLLGFASPGGTNREMEIDFGIGGAGSEVVVATQSFISMSVTNADNKAFVVLPFGITLGNNVRVAARARANSAVANTIPLSILYSLSFDGNEVNNVPFTIPSAGLAVVTPNASGWANSSYVEMSASLADKTGIMALTYDPGASSLDFEIDLATGGAGSESVITTLRGCSTAVGNNGCPSDWWLPAIIEIAKNSRVAARIRKTGTDVNPWDFVLNAIPITGGGGGAGKGNKGNKGGGGINIQTPGGPNIINFNPGVDIGSL